MKVIMYMAMSINGIIARENDSEDFLSDENWTEFCRLAKNAGCFIIGRKTYAVVRALYKDYSFEDVKAKKIIITRNKNFRQEGYITASSARDAIKKAKVAGFRKLILTGGSRTNTSFMKDGLINEIILDIEPVLIGKGIRLFTEDNFEARLKLIKIRKIKRGIIQLHYKVKK